MGKFRPRSRVGLEFCRFGGEGENLFPVAMKSGAVLAAAGVFCAACATIKVEAPDKPIEINLNVNIQQEVRVKLEREVEDLIANNPDIF